MQSIIDEIAAAEQRADEIRAEATAQARTQITAANESAIQAMDELDAAERAKTREAVESAEISGEKTANALFAEMEAEADKQCLAAKEHIEEAVEYLLKRVQI